MLRAHRQAWAWQDEWIDKTIDDIRRLEAETAAYLQTVMKSENENFEANGDAADRAAAIKATPKDEESEEEGDDSSCSSEIYYDCVESSSPPRSIRRPPPLERRCTAPDGNKNDASSPPLTPRRDPLAALLLLVFHGDFDVEVCAMARARNETLQDGGLFAVAGRLERVSLDTRRANRQPLCAAA